MRHIFFYDFMIVFIQENTLTLPFSQECKDRDEGKLPVTYIYNRQQ